MNTNIYTYSLADLESFCAESNIPRFRAKQLYEWIHTHNATSYNQMTNLPKALREQLAEVFPLSQTHVIEKQISIDATRKFLLALADGELVETVGIPSNPTHENVSRETFLSQNSSDSLLDDRSCISLPSDSPAAPSSSLDRLTVCFSTQVGCGMGCVFCATGSEGFSRNLSAQEMVDQAVIVQRDFQHRISNIVAMGQGEPFLNYDNLLVALRRFNTDEGFQIGARHITISTCGIIDGIQRFAQEPEQFTLAISLHSAIQSKRDRIMPALARQPLQNLKKAIQEYISIKNRRVTFEYLLLDGINDGEEDLLALVEFCSGLLCHINLIPFNETGGAFRGVSQSYMRSWVDYLESHHISTTIRNSKGADISGACGQLKNVSRETSER